MGSRYLIRKVVGACLTIFMIVILNFVLFRMMPGSPDRILLRNPNVTADAMAAARIRWGLDKPLIPDQLVDYLESTASGDLGFSFKFHGEPVTGVLAGRIWPTVILFGLGEVLAIIFGLALGAYSGWRRGGPIDYIGNGISLILYSMPYFVIGILILGVFAIGLHWLPPGDWGGISHLVLPAAALAFPYTAYIARLMRGSTLEVLGSRFILTARAKGLPLRTIMLRHALKPALLPLVSFLGPALAGVITGSIVIETTFGLPGIGRYFTTGALNRDYTLVMGITILYGALILFLNLLVDLCYAALDPRVRYAR